MDPSSRDVTSETRGRSSGVNAAMTEGFEEDVGTRTSFYFHDVNTMKNSQASARKFGYKHPPQDKDTIYTTISSGIRDYVYFDAAMSWKPVESGRDKSKAPPSQYGEKPANTKFRMLHPDFMRYLKYHWLDSPRRKGKLENIYRPTTGGSMLLTALHVCDVTDVYGFITADHTKYNDHYYETDWHKQAPCAAFDFMDTISLVSSLIVVGAATAMSRPPHIGFPVCISREIDNTPMKLLPLRPRRSASPPQKICFAPVVPLRPRRNSALPPSFCLAPNGGTAHSRHENRLQNDNKGCAAKFKVAHAPTNILDHLSAKWRCTNPSHSKVYPYLTAHDFRVDCELCRHWGLSRRTGAKQNCAGGVEERRGRSRFFAGAKQNGGGEEEGVSWGSWNRHHIDIKNNSVAPLPSPSALLLTKTRPRQTKELSSLGPTKHGAEE
ncbi:protein sialylation [Branchiostoma belcheri]|nr:protein sialylation [Branchiostoma belcheri]